MGRQLIISNTTPLINFAEVGRMDVLEGLFETITIPPAVVKELDDKEALFPKAREVPLLSSVVTKAPEDQLLVRGYAGRVHPGEAECLALAMEHPGSLLLLDDLAARDLAASNHLLFTGTLGCLIRAKKKNLIPAVRPILQDLRTVSRFWISTDLEDRVLRELGEL